MTRKYYDGILVGGILPFFLVVGVDYFSAILDALAKKLYPAAILLLGHDSQRTCGA